MRSRTLSVEIATSPSTLYAFVRDPAQLPVWAAGLCQSVTVQGDVWLVETGSALGTVQLTFCADNPHGVLDHTVTLADGMTVLNPVRVIANGNGSEILFTVFQTPGMPDELFVRDVQAVRRDLHTLKALLEA